MGWREIWYEHIRWIAKRYREFKEGKREMVTRTSAVAVTAEAATVVEGTGTSSGADTATSDVANKIIGTSWLDLASVQITTSKESDIYVAYGAWFWVGSGTDTTTIRLVRDTTQLASDTTSSTTGKHFADVYKDAAVAAGTYTYKLQIKGSDGAAVARAYPSVVHPIAVST